MPSGWENRAAPAFRSYRRSRSHLECSLVLLLVFAPGGGACSRRTMPAMAGEPREHRLGVVLQRLVSHRLASKLGDRPDALEKLFVAAQQGTADSRVVSFDVLRRRIDDDIRAEIEWPL